MNSETAPTQPTSPPPVTSILLVRHGENDWVKSQKLAGRTSGVHLNETGRAQSRRLSARLAAWPIAAIYSSPLERCAETADILAAPHRLTVALHPGLLEADYGEWQGQEIDRLKRDELWQVIQRTPSFARFPGGEPMRAMQSRIVDALHEIVAQHTGQIIVVCSHADLIKAALAHFLGMHFDQFQRLHVSTASVSVIHFLPSGPHVSRLNDTGELEPPRPSVPAISGEDPVASQTPFNHEPLK